MMPKNIVLLAAILISIACQPRKRYPNMDKWILPNAVDRRPLHGQPREVIEYSIFEADTARPEKWREVYFHYRFNADGDMVNRASYLSGALITTDEYQYDENGVQAKSTDVKRGEFSGIVSRAQGNYSYRSISTRRDGTAIGSMDSFPPGGGDQIEKQYQDTALTGTPFFEGHMYFGRLSFEWWRYNGMALFSFPFGCAGQRPGMGRRRFGGEARSPRDQFE